LGNCQCTTEFNEILIDSTDIYNKIKKADSGDFRNKVVAIGVGAAADPVYLQTVSDSYLGILTFDEIDVEAMAAEVTTTLRCGQMARPSFAPTPSGVQPCTESAECGPNLDWATRGQICAWELDTEICIEGFCTENACDNPLDFCEASCEVTIST
jgi:hypothetical protein